MDILKSLGRKAVRTEPQLWVRRFAILRDDNPDTPILRDIPLEQGVNIVWAREDEKDDASTPITGHSAGKTTFCRLLRYCLGEKTYGTAATRKAVEKAFPEGFVAAELRVAGKTWAVMRPIGSRLYSQVLEDGTLEELLRDKGRRVTVDRYTEVIGIEGLMDAMEGPNLTADDDPVEWEHILAWCTRDQEARFRNLHEWRAVRSESETAGFRFKKAGPMRVMRVALGLYERDEIEGEERLAKVQEKRDATAKLLEEAEREPQFLLNLHLRTLRDVIGPELPEETGLAERPLRSDELQKCLTRLAEETKKTIQGRIDTHQSQTGQKQATIRELIAEEIALRAESGPLQSAVTLLTAGANAENADAAEIDSLRAFLDKDGNTFCAHARVLFADCSEIVKRLDTLSDGVIRTAHEQEMDEARREQQLQIVRPKLADLIAKTEECKARREALDAEVRELTTQATGDRTKLANLQAALDDAIALDSAIREGTATENVARLKATVADLDAEHKTLIDNLNLALSRHNENRTLLERIYSGAVRSVLPASEYDGVVRFTDRALQFGVKRGAAMGGEAVETLSILLADVSCMLYNALNAKSCLPGIWVHDSPREADLGLRIYRSFLRFVVAQQHHFRNHHYFHLKPNYL